MNRTVTLCLLLTVAIALALRLPQPDARPMHSDEGVNTIKFRALWETGSYKYDPAEFHGPTLPYFTLIWAKLSGAPKNFAQFDESIFRTVTVLFGVGLILILPLLADGLGRRATLCAGVLIAVSPAMVFYSRYYIHEMLLVFFSLLALAAAWRYTQHPKLAWALLAGISVGLMDATKETFVFTLAAFFIAGVANELWRRRIDATAVAKPFRFKTSHFVLGAAAALIVAVVLFTSFFTNKEGPLDSLRTYLAWTHRAEGQSPHIHPWSFYLERLLFYHVASGPVWSEGLICLLAVFAMVGVFRHRLPANCNANFIRFVALYTLVLTLIYCVVPYKTPWCFLNFWIGFILLAGVGATALLERSSTRLRRIAFTTLLLIGVGQLSLEAWQASIGRVNKPGNPYAYSPTASDALELAEQVEALASAHPLGHQVTIQVIAPQSDYWPLPWYLRAFANVGWQDHIPSNPDAPLIIVSKNFDANLDTNKNYVMPQIYSLRRDAFFELYVETNLWTKYLSTRKPEP